MAAPFSLHLLGVDCWNESFQSVPVAEARPATWTVHEVGGLQRDDFVCHHVFRADVAVDHRIGSRAVVDMTALMGRTMPEDRHLISDTALR